MRRRFVLSVVALAAVAALAGCGSSSSSSSKGGPLGTALSYLPSGSPLVIKLETNPRGPALSSTQSLLSRFPAVRLGEAGAVARLGQLGIDYSTDVRPLLGNPVVFGATTQTVSKATEGQFVVAWVVKDPATLRSDLRRLGRHSTGTYEGATLYPLGSGLLAVNGATVVASRDAAAVKTALHLHSHGGGMSASAYAGAVKGLPANALIDVSGSLTGVLSSPRAANARRVPWVAAIRGYGIAVSANSGGLAIDYRVDTSGGSLSSSQLPLASGSASPGLAGTLPIEAGIRDPAQAVLFFESVGQATQPASYRTFQSREAALRKRTGVDLDSLAKLLTGDSIIESDGHTTLARATVSSPAAARHVLAKLASAPPQLLFSHATHVSALPGGFYRIRRSGSTVSAGLVGDQLVVGKASPAALKAFAHAPVTHAGSARGAIAFRIALTDLLGLALHRAPSGVGQVVLRMLGDITGWSGVSTSALTGHAALAVK